MAHEKRAAEWSTKRERPMDLDDDVVAANDEGFGGIIAGKQCLSKTLTMSAVILKMKPVVLVRNGIRMIDEEPASPLLVDFSMELIQFKLKRNHHHHPFSSSASAHASSVSFDTSYSVPLPQNANMAAYSRK